MRITNISIVVVAGIVVAATILISPRAALSQLSPSGILAPQMQIIATPSEPAPNTTVTLEAKSYSTDLNALDMTWYINGSVLASGYGLKTARVTVGSTGTETRIRVVGRVSGATVVESTIVLRPSEIALIVEANSTAPTWFRGRNLPSPRGTVRVTAFPTLSGTYASLSAARLLYTWQIDNSDAIALSAIGAQTFVLNLPKAPAATTRVRVTITDPRGTYAASGFTHVTAEDPRIVLFSNRHSSMGRAALEQSVTLRTGDALGLVAVPFYTGKNSTLKYEWMSNGQRMLNQGSEGRILLTMPKLPTTYSITGLISNTENAFESARATLTLKVE